MRKLHIITHTGNRGRHNTGQKDSIPSMTQDQDHSAAEMIQTAQGGKMEQRKDTTIINAVQRDEAIRAEKGATEKDWDTTTPPWEEQNADEQRENEDSTDEQRADEDSTDEQRDNEGRTDEQRDNEGSTDEANEQNEHEKIPTPWLEPFLAMMVCENAASRNTQQAYTTDMMRWFRFAFMHHITAIGPEHHPMFIQFLQNVPLSDRSISRNLSAVRHYFYFLSTEGIIPHDPWQGLRNPQYRAQLPQPLTVASVAALLGKSHQDQSAEGIRLSAVLELLYATGMRISELISLPLFHLSNENAPSLRIAGKGGHERFVFFTPQATAALDRYMGVRQAFLPKPDNPYLFPSRGKSGHLTRQRVGQLLKDLALRAGICPESVNPHGLRHAFATHLLQRGVDLVTLKHLLGHQDISTTQIYTHVQTERWAELLTRHHPLGKRLFPGMLD